AGEELEDDLAPVGLVDLVEHVRVRLERLTDLLVGVVVVDGPGDEAVHGVVLGREVDDDLDLVGGHAGCGGPAVVLHAGVALGRELVRHGDETGLAVAGVEPLVLVDLALGLGHRPADRPLGAVRPHAVAAVGGAAPVGGLRGDVVAVVVAAEDDERTDDGEHHDDGSDRPPPSHRAAAWRCGSVRVDARLHGSPLGVLGSGVGRCGSGQVGVGSWRLRSMAVWSTPRYAVTTASAASTSAGGPSAITAPRSMATSRSATLRTSGMSCSTTTRLAPVPSRMRRRSG